MEAQPNAGGRVPWGVQEHVRYGNKMDLAGHYSTSYGQHPEAEALFSEPQIDSKAETSFCKSENTSWVQICHENLESKEPLIRLVFERDSRFQHLTSRIEKVEALCRGCRIEALKLGKDGELHKPTAWMSDSSQSEESMLTSGCSRPLTNLQLYERLERKVSLIATYMCVPTQTILTSLSGIPETSLAMPGGGLC